MKSRISKILGVVVILATLASLVVLPASPASAATNQMVFTPVSTPSNLNNFLGGVSCTNPGPLPATYTYRPNGSVHVNNLVTTADGKTLYAWDDAAKILYESMDSGKTWPNYTYINTASAVVGMAISPKFATDGAVVLADATEVWLVTGGITNVVSVTGNLSTQREGGVITSIDAGYFFSTNTLSFLVGVMGGAGAISNVLLFQNGGFTWTEVGDMKQSGTLAVTGGALASAGLYDPQVVKAIFSPNHQSDAEIMAVYTSAQTQAAGSVFANAGANGAYIGITTVSGVGAITAVSIINGGSLYTTGDTITLLTPLTGSAAVLTVTATPIVAGVGGVITALAIFTAGTKYVVSDTWLGSILGTLDWNNTILPKCPLDVVGGPLAATGAVIAVGTDYIGNTGGLILVGTQGFGANEGVYRITSRASQAGTVSNPAVLVTGAAGPVYSIAVNGSLAAATTTVAVGLKNQANASGIWLETGVITASTITWLNPAAYKFPTGSTAMNTTLVYANSGKSLYAGTTGTDSAISLSTDNGNSFDQIGLIDVGGLGTGAYGTITAAGGAVSGPITGANITSGGLNYGTNVAVSILGSGDGLFANGVGTVNASGTITSIAVTTTGVAGYVTGQPWIATNVSNPSLTVVNPTLWFCTISVKSRASGLYKSTDAGKSWVRILAWTGSLSQGRSPTFTTDNIFFVTNKSTIALETTDGGHTYTPVGAPVSIKSASIIENGQFYMCGMGVAQFYLSGRWTNATFTPTTTGYINNFSRASATIDKTQMTIAAGTSVGTVYLSKDGGVTFNQVGTSGPCGPNDMMNVTFDPSGNLVAYPSGYTASPADASGTNNGNVVASMPGLFMWQPATSTWRNFDTTANGIYANGGSLFLGADGTAYATGDYTFGTGASAGNGVFRTLNYAATNPDGSSAAIWQQINSTNFPGTLTAPSIGTSYASYPTSTLSVLGACAGVVNTLHNTAGAGFADSRSSLKVVAAATGNTLYITEASNAAVNLNQTAVIYTFVDPFIVGPAITSPKDATVLTTDTSASMNWTALNGPGTADTPSGTNYIVQLTTSKDFTGTTTAVMGCSNSATIYTAGTTGLPTATLGKIVIGTTGLDAYTSGNAVQTIGINPAVHSPPLSTDNQLAGGTKYYWQVMAITPLLSRATVGSFTTALSAVNPGPVATNPVPNMGATDVDVNTTFTWPPVTSATGYEFVIAEELGAVDKFAIIDYSATTTLNAHKLRETLKYNTQYWWRVRPVSGSSTGAWTTSFFTTEKAPTTTPTTAAVTPTIILPTQPVVTPIVTVTNMPSTTPSQPVIPTYLLWAVIAVGAILVIAVVVLIVRTRRIS